MSDDEDRDGYAPWAGDKYDASADADLMEITPPDEGGDEAEQQQEGKRW